MSDEKVQVTTTITDGRQDRACIKGETEFDVQSLKAICHGTFTEKMGPEITVFLARPHYEKQFCLLMDWGSLGLRTELNKFHFFPPQVLGDRLFFFRREILLSRGKMAVLILMINPSQLVGFP